MDEATVRVDAAPERGSWVAESRRCQGLKLTAGAWQDRQMTLWGRETEQSAVGGLLDRLPTAGSALVLRGQPGIGKSSILAYVQAEAVRRGFRVRTVSGIQAEFHLPNAALRALLGSSVSEHGNSTATALEALNLLSGEDAPNVLLVDDAQWVDPSSWETLTFIARRVESEPILALFAVREGEVARRRLVGARLPELEIGALSPEACGVLIDEVAPRLPVALRARVLAEAAGNPLGVIELASAADRLGERGVPLGLVSLDTRLDRAYRTMAEELPARTRTLLCVAAVNDRDRLDEILCAADQIAEGASVADLESAVAIGLIEVDDVFRVRFRHPLVRSAIQQLAGVAGRAEAHAALSNVVAEPDRRIWHRASASVGRAPHLADELAQVALAARQRGELVTAIAAWQRAIQLAEPGQDRGGWRVAAANAAAYQGDIGALESLISEAGADDLYPADRVHLAWLAETYLTPAWSGADRLPASIEVALQLQREGDADRALDLLASLGVRCSFANPEPPVRAAFVAAAEQMGADPDDARLLSVYALADPIERGALALPGMRHRTGRVDTRGEELQMMTTAASNLGAIDLAASFAARAIADYRSRGMLGQLAQTLVSQAWAAAHMGDTILGRTAAAEAHELAAETAQPLWVLTADMIGAKVAALRGDEQTALDLAAEAERVLLSVGVHPMLALVQEVRGITALAAGRFDEAFEELARILDPGDIAYHYPTGWVVFEHLADAAIGAGRERQLAVLAESLTPVAQRSQSPALQAGLAFAEALLSGDDLFGAALSLPTGKWPFSRARLHLAYGARLRRNRRSAESRPHLRAALSVFEAFGLAPWAARAQRELRASGEMVRRRADARQDLTPQELQVAVMAAEGLSNREIASRLFLSPRTVGSHLYRIYPKVGVKTRTELARAMMFIDGDDSM
ncbi:AAA family ATPase [Micromonospora terminaliae]|uniref:AAA family ATPase n=1 Tax=Micromonospora terminaliae TaxID=1914461 RepID=A0AAJ2ZD81_9ACTN|nr:helix-turn-helix transcriptional regulator [Micromonospora terminaliae]NES28030.1 AAA family ATPase [Micromonospora terminaliae]QGL47214.1 AAA family ATPase [Micromonospora terminaliae]